uniref:Putative secreted protein n=1 Tax=Anopheles darlingi TaxID=43151 RepID=A0A2M4D8I8_ANODA
MTSGNQMAAVRMWARISWIPIIGGIMLLSTCSSGWQYMAVQANGALHSWCFLCTYRYSGPRCSNRCT